MWSVEVRNPLLTDVRRLARVAYRCDLLIDGFQEKVPKKFPRRLGLVLVDNYRFFYVGFAYRWASGRKFSRGCLKLGVAYI